jgi:hypothetical protein
MRSNLIVLPLLLCASPLLAQPAPQLPPELTDPATAQRLTNAMQAVSDAFLDMRVGEVQAALEGRPATPQERRLTVRDLERRKDPDFDRRFQHKLASVGPKMQQSMQAVNQALPAVMQSLEQAQRAIERAVANMPDPTYPRR